MLFIIILQIGIFRFVLSVVTFPPSLQSCPQTFILGFHICVSFCNNGAHSVFPESQSNACHSSISLGKKILVPLDS